MIKTNANIAMSIPYSNVIAESPAIIADQETVAAVINQTVTLSVHISTFLPPETTLHITWSLPNRGDLSVNDTSIEYQSTGSSLLLTNVTTDNAGEYVCTVEQISNSPTTRSASIHLRLFSKLNSKLLMWQVHARTCPLMYTNCPLIEPLADT